MKADAGAERRQPVVVAKTPLPNGVRLTLEVPGDLVWFAGHFPSDPLLPGVAQTGWAIALARAHFDFSADPPALDRVKFQRPVRPGARLELELTRDPARPAQVVWTLSEAGQAVGGGRMDFAPETQ